MGVSTSTLLAFPKEFPGVKVGILLIDDNLLITGHENGFVVKWDLKSKTDEILHECSSPVEAISRSQTGEIAVGCHSGLLFTFTLSNPKKQNIIQDATHSKFSRIWRMKWVSENSIMVGSTYGVLNLYVKDDPGWILASRLEGHYDSIFGLGGSNHRYIASGDWAGKIIIWQHGDVQYEPLDSVNLGAAIEGISLHNTGAFATIDEFGRINFLEQHAIPPEWTSVFQTDIASSRGRCVFLTEDAKTVFGGTNTELIQFDIDTQQVEVLPIQHAREIFSKDNDILVLTDDRLLSFVRRKIVVPANAVKYKYSKVSLIGHTGAGKTTLCSLITSGSAEDISSTFGKKVWNWRIPGKDGGSETRIVLHDHGGQETVLDTFLPFLADSDIVLIFFKKTDATTFEKALKIRKELKSVVPSKTKIYFVETFIDQPLDEIDRTKLQGLITEGTITDCFKVSPAAGVGIDDFKRLLIGAIDWSSTKTMIRSEYVESLERSISALVENKATVMSFEDFKEFHENNSGRPIATNHLKFLLTNFSSQGSIEYYPDVADSIIFHDEKYNELRSNIPIIVAHNNGIISVKEIQAKFDHHDYIKMLDQLYITYGLAVENDDLRIFPSKLKENLISISDTYLTFLTNPSFQGEMAFPIQDVKIGRLLKALSELKLSCIDVSMKEGLFAWEMNACIYYKYEETGDAIKGRYIKFSYVVGGQKEPRYNRLFNEFQTIIERLYGPRLQNPNPDKKKDLRTTRFDVALSFAGEQRPYVSNVFDHLAKKGVNVFYDELYESHLWGRDLSEYLHKIFYSQSKWCIMFISKQYVEKIWPTHERKSALAKQVEVKDGYILPVRFDDTEVPGLPTTLAYEDARKKSPEDIANLFLKKFEDS